MVANRHQMRLENLEDTFSQESIALLQDASKKLINALMTSRKLPDPVSSELASAVQLALVGLEKVVVKGDEIKQALLQGGSPATPDDLRKRFVARMIEKGFGTHEIAGMQRISERRVQQILRELEVAGLVQVVGPARRVKTQQENALQENWPPRGPLKKQSA